MISPPDPPKADNEMFLLFTVMAMSSEITKPAKLKHYCPDMIEGYFTVVLLLSINTLVLRYRPITH